MPRTELLFATRLYSAKLARAAALNVVLAETCLGLMREDRAGRTWSRAHGYKGYTSYASLDDLTRRASVFAELARRLDPHVRAFARAQDWETARRKPVLDSLWVNVMAPGGVHSAHIHPHAAVSGTYYVTVPKGAGAIRFEDPRLPLMMAAPVKKPRARRESQPFVSVTPAPGLLLLWESFLRHEVHENRARGQRISISFNYRIG